MTVVQWIGCVMLAAVVGRVACGGELRNGSFEEQGEAPDRAAGWSRWGDWINRESAWKPTRGGQCLLGYHHWRIQKADSSGVWQDIADVPRGYEVIFSVYATADAAGEGAEDFEAVELRLETTLWGEQSTIASKRWTREAIETNGRWSRLALRSVVPADTLRVLIIVYPGPGRKPRGGSVKFDEARLEFIPPDS